MTRQVWRAEVDHIGGHQGTLLVAVKSAKESATAKEHQVRTASRPASLDEKSNQLVY